MDSLLALAIVLGLVAAWPLIWYFGARKPRPEMPLRSEGLVDLTDWERRFIVASDGKCPDCEMGTLLYGPEAGCSVNMRCDTCGTTFNVVIVGGHVQAVQRVKVGSPQ